MNKQELEKFLNDNQATKYWETNLEKEELSFAGYFIRGIPVIVVSSGDHYKLFGEVQPEIMDIAIKMISKLDSSLKDYIKERTLLN